ncbi:MAG: hypothetical protein GY747_02560 [Planctomycetes bacterium]|nr:hypothetical protein [Planctomycetota bacterium]MCP4770218.1 hypothetical protein [Planctomycetota bacterium]MCP4860634.1 hypothetical protein [Planctomycetota bacterium]
MPSNFECNCPDAVKTAASASLGDFRSSLATAVGLLRGSLAQITGDSKKKQEIAEKSLGSFAAGRIDASRFDEFATNKTTIEASAGPVIERALDVMVELMDAGDALNRVRLEEGQNLRCLLSKTTKNIGRAFGAAQAVELAKVGNYVEAEHGGWFDAFLYKNWSSVQRNLAPAVVVELANGSAQTTNLGEYVDGNFKAILVYGQDCPPAPLARLVTPGVFVLQTSDCLGLDDFLSFEGSGIAAVVPLDAAHFAHDPRRGNTLAERMVGVELPETPSLRHRGGLSVMQQQQDLAQLQALASAETPAAAAEGKAAKANPVDKLAAFLLGKAHLEEA